MSNSLRGMLAGLVATLVLSGILIFKGNTDLWPELNIIRLLVSLGSIQTVAAWMDHFIVGVVVWGLMFSAFDSLWESRAYWLKGLLFGVFAWFLMMVLFMPLAKAGMFGTRIGPSATPWGGLSPRRRKEKKSASLQRAGDGLMSSGVAYQPSITAPA